MKHVAAKRIVLTPGRRGTLSELLVAIQKVPIERTAQQRELIATVGPVTVAMAERAIKASAVNNPALEKAAREFMDRASALRDLIPHTIRDVSAGAASGQWKVPELVLRGPVELRPSTASEILFAVQDVGAGLRAVTTRLSSHDDQLRAQGEELARLRSGAPGRPSNMLQVLAEFERRIERGELEPSAAAQGRALAQWCVQTHPDGLRPTAKSIENRIRDRYRSARA